MPRSLIICATPRSGSYLLSDLLHQAGLPFAEEWLTPFHQSARKKAYGKKEGMPFMDYLELLVEREQRDGLFAMKVMYPQFYRLMGMLEEDPDLVGQTALERFQSLFPDPLFVFMTRENKLAQAISHLKARQTGQWVKRRDKDPENGIEPIYSYLGICKALEDREQSETLWNAFLEEHQLPVVRVVYEDLVKDPVPSVGEIFRDLNRPFPPEGKFEQTRTFLPMASGLNRDWENQYRQDHELTLSKGRARRTGDLASLSVREVLLPDRIEVGQRANMVVQVATNGKSVSPVGLSDGSGWLRVIGAWIGDTNAEPEPFEQELRQDSEGGLVARCPLPPVAAAGSHTLKCILADRSLEMEDLLKSRGHEMVVQIRYPPAREAARKLLSGVMDLRNGWQYLEWFGYFLDDKFPWVYTADHEWLYFEPKPRENGSFHILDANLGWLEVFPQSYPLIQSLDHGGEWEFLRREADKRWFRETASGREFRTETNRPEHLRKLNTEKGD